MVHPAVETAEFWVPQEGLVWGPEVHPVVETAEFWVHCHVGGGRTVVGGQTVGAGVDGRKADGQWADG